jgi:hypothetical protein
MPRAPPVTTATLSLSFMKSFPIIVMARLDRAIKTVLACEVLAPRSSRGATPCVYARISSSACQSKSTPCPGRSGAMANPSSIRSGSRTYLSRPNPWASR